jgi:hypothetical protein
VAARRLVVEDVVVPVPGAPELDGLRVLHISDTHVSHEGDWVLEMVRSLSDIDVDLIAVTGDVISSVEGLPPAAAAIGSLRSGLGTYVVPGNHDHWIGRHLNRVSGEIGGFVSPRLYAREFAQHGVDVLVNDSVTIVSENGEANLVGLDDPFLGLGDAESAYSGLDDDRPNIVLGHSPDGAELINDRRCDLYLCGHTHGGQILGPAGLPPQQTNTAYPLPATFGLMVHRGVLTHVSAGLGTAVIPLRLNCPPRATVLILRNIEADGRNTEQGRHNHEDSSQTSDPDE